MQTTLTASAGIEQDLKSVDWSFNGVETDYYTHGLHNYPARMIPQIPRTLFEHWKSTGRVSDNDLVFDPFSGSGTTAVEARLHGLNALATDINPFACLLSRAKATTLDTDKLEAAIGRCLGTDWLYRERFINEDYQAATERHETVHGGDLNPENGQKHYHHSVKDGWFPEPQLAKIEAMARQLSELRGKYNHKIIRFIRIALAQTARKISYQRDREFKRHRIPEEDRSDHDPPFTATFREQLNENIGRIKDFSQQVDATTDATIELADCRKYDLEPSSVQAIVTSPPYGDHSTTVGYGQFSQDPATVSTPLDIDLLKDVDPSGLGGKRSGRSLTLETVADWSPTLKTTLAELEKKDGRHDDVLDFFTDYAESLLVCARVIEPGQPIALVVGNRTVSRTPIPTHLITTEIALSIGLSHEKTLPRSIPSKTLPYANAPENIPGQSGEMIADEYILVFGG